eukprot:g3996.t1
MIQNSGGSFPSTRLDTSILCPGNPLSRHEIISPDRDSISSEETVSDSEFGAIDSRELLAAKQLRRMRFSEGRVINKRQKLFSSDPLTLLPPHHEPIESDSGRRLKELHNVKFPDLMRSLAAVNEQLRQSEEVLKPLRDFIYESHEYLKGVRASAGHYGSTESRNPR